MKLEIAHDTVYRYDEPAHLIVQALRMWPAPTPMQQVSLWRVQVDERVLPPTCVDGFGNPLATHTIDQRVDRVQLSVRGRVETHERAGVHGNSGETLPPMFYQRPTALTAASEPITALAQQMAGDGSALERLHRLMLAVRERVDYLPQQTDAETTAAEAFAAGAGVCQDHAHVLIAAARALGFPARYVSGYLCPIGDVPAASHAWAEIFVDDLGWVGFDAANRQSPDERFVRLACGRDYRDAAPVHGMRHGGQAETLEVTVSVAQSEQ